MNFFRRLMSLSTTLCLLILLVILWEKKITKKSGLKRSYSQDDFLDDYSDSITVTKFRAPVLALDDFEDGENGYHGDKEHNVTVHRQPEDTHSNTGNGTPETKECTPKKNVVFLRTHKTGSSTLQAILYRYGELNNLTFALPDIGSNLGAPRLFHPRFIRASKNKTYNMLVGHARYDKWAFSVTMPKDTVYITILREPGDQFQSLYKYYNWYKRFGVALPEFLENPFLYYKKLEPDNAIESALNPNLFDLGLERQFLNDRRKIKEQINKIENGFNLVMIMEYFEESIILLKDLLCWDLDSMTFLVKNARSTGGRLLDKDDLNRIKVWNTGDDQLYDHFNGTLWQKIEQYGESKVREEVKRLQNMNAKLKEDCVKGSESTSNGKSATRVVAYTVKDTKAENDTCVLLTLSNDAFQTRATKRQFGRL